MATSPHDRIRALLRLAADQHETEEGRTAAVQAARLIAKFGYPPPETNEARREYAPPEPAERRRAPRWPESDPRWAEKKRDLVTVVADEVVQFLRTVDVLPKGVPMYGIQLAPSRSRGVCGCGEPYRRGEMVSRERVPRCARCVAGRVRHP